MAIKQPLVLSAIGEIEQLQLGDTVETNVLDTQSFLAVNSDIAALPQGSPVYINVDGGIRAADASSVITAGVIGVVQDTLIATAVLGRVLTDGTLTVADWTAIAGTATLTVGGVYFLDATTPGMISLTAPSDAGDSLVRIGTAVNGTTLELSVGRPIKL